MSDQDTKIEPLNMAQTMSVAALMVGSMFSLFFEPEDTDEHKTMISYLCIAVFLNQFCSAAQHKDKMIGVLEAVIAELKESV